MWIKVVFPSSMFAVGFILPGNTFHAVAFIVGSFIVGCLLYIIHLIEKLVHKQEVEVQQAKNAVHEKHVPSSDGFSESR